VTASGAPQGRTRDFIMKIPSGSPFGALGDSRDFYCAHICALPRSEMVIIGSKTTSVEQGVFGLIRLILSATECHGLTSREPTVNRRVVRVDSLSTVLAVVRPLVTW
jgi:hypothetical protein